MSKRKNLELIEDLAAIVKTQCERIDTLQKALDTVLERNPDLVEQDKLKMLDQSVFDGQDEKWRWAAIDGDSRVNLYENEPIVRGNQWVLGLDDTVFFKIGRDFDVSNWQNSLIEREAKPLDGNERIKKLLDAGKLVMVALSNSSYEDAAKSSCYSLCMAFNYGSQKPIHTQIGSWAYGIPIDNNGNEILDVE